MAHVYSYDMYHLCWAILHSAFSFDFSPLHHVAVSLVKLISHVSSLNCQFRVGVKFDSKILLPVKELTFCNSAHPNTTWPFDTSLIFKENDNVSNGRIY